MIGKMYLLITDKEIAQFLSSVVNYKISLKSMQISWSNTNEYLGNFDKKILTTTQGKQKFKEKIKKAVSKDLNNYYTTVSENLSIKRKQNIEFIYKNLPAIIKKIGHQKILDAYKISKKDNFVKSTGLQISKKSSLIRRKDFLDMSQDCFFRNMEGNESMLLNKMQNNYPFWFIDTGYTNFLETNKKWHRLVRNNLHHSNLLDVPVDRLEVFKEFPKPWRSSGDKILVIEPGIFSANTFNVNVSNWKIDIEKEIRQYTDKPIVFREKFNKKIRTNLYQELLNEDYYCVVNINSNAATEAIWAGIPVITLSKHITNSVSTSKISEINSLYKPNLANWLCSLSYSQFTYEELINGTAVNIVRKYHV